MNIHDTTITNKLKQMNKSMDGKKKKKRQT